VIAKAGKPMVKVMALNAPEPSQMKRFRQCVGARFFAGAGIR